MKNPSVYIAILNSGWVRSELLLLLPRMMRTRNVVKAVLQNPLDTWGVPETHNRNRIVRRCLSEGCDYLVMIDSDNVPEKNPIELIFEDKDIIGCPCQIRQRPSGKPIWTAWNYADGRFESIDLDGLNNPPELLAVDAVATNCIVIKRRVLEKMKAPFEVVFDEDGLRTRGCDIEFCRKAKEAGFEVYTATKRRCKHFRCQNI